jgi:hypothetical protein
MIGWVIVKDGKFLSPHGYVPRPDQAQWYRSAAEAEAGIADLRKSARGLVDGASVTETKLPNEGVGGHYAQAESEYNPWGIG